MARSRLIGLRATLRVGLVALAAGTWTCTAAAQGSVASPWLEGQRPNAQATAALALLADAASHGLDPRDYGLPALARRLAAGEPDAATPLPHAQAWAAALTTALQRYLRDLHDGRVRPAQIDHRFAPAQAEPFDAAAAIDAALALQDLSSAVRSAVPVVPQYQKLRDALAVYRALGEHPAWRQALPQLPVPPGGSTRSLKPGDTWAGLPTLAARLAAWGDLPATPTPTGAELPAPTHYDDALVLAVQGFQQRHGRLADGVIGPDTLRALQVPPAQRVRQLELALERLRWTPLMRGPRMIVVNIPEYVLRAYEVQGGRIAVRAQMKVIVGKSLDTRTPIFDETLRSIEFNPFWNVPASIARKELVPRLRRDPAHWAREGYEFVGAGGPADMVLSEAKLQAVLAGQLRIRQRPGPRNALGDIKFVFPNRDAIFLHHTPATQLFERSRRDFSHGCIRVEQPVALAEFALQGLPGWDEGRIRQAMSQGRLSTVSLAQPVPVLIAYGTALVKDTRVHFFDDVYGQDRRLDAALRQRPRPALDIPQ